ncbi:MAG: hypothetical protein RLZZ200_863 [Pseudomonadota bacterium]|jgi:AcrR family transcriptional regulator
MPTGKRRSSSRNALAPKPRKRTQTYHREDLRGELLAAARRFVAESGHARLSIRVLASELGVSPGAPYHHFPDRRSLLLALAGEGFIEMMAGAAVVAGSGGTPRARLHRLGADFIRFADRNPNLVELMYESELTTPSLDPALLVFQLQGHQLIRRVVGEASPSLPDRDVDLRVIAFWSTVYGFASMRRKGVLHPHRPSGVETRNITKAIVDRACIAALGSADPT